MNDFKLTTSKTITIFNNLHSSEISFDAFKYALAGYNTLNDNHKLNNDTLITLIDYSKPSSEERLFVIDLKNQTVVNRSLVAHGKGTGVIYPLHFSNLAQSHQSSLGFFITEEAYFGKHGYSLRINGIEEKINDNARERAIVFHGAFYVSKNYIAKYGRIGRSYGCPALPIEMNKEIIDIIKDGSCVFIYYPANDYLTRSELINSWQYSQIIPE